MKKKSVNKNTKKKPEDDESLTEKKDQTTKGKKK